MFLKIRTWNVRTLRGPGKGEQIAMEMGRYELDILSVTETHIPGSGTLILHEEKGTTMMFSGRADSLMTEGVGLAINPRAKSTLRSRHPVSSRLLTAEFLTQS